MLEGYRISAPDDLRRLTGFYLPKHGVYDLSGNKIGKMSTSRRSCRLVPGKMQGFIIDEDGKRVASVLLQRIRVAYEKTSDLVIGIFPAVELAAHTYNTSGRKIQGRITELLESED